MQPRRRSAVNSESASINDVGTDVLDYYAAPGRFTDLANIGVSTADVAAAVRIVQGLLIYDAVAEPFYGVQLDPRQAEAIHERDSARLLALAQAIDPRPLNQPRPPGARVGARCHAYTRMTVSLLRAAGVPARSRCGFGTYFRPGWFEDHWVAEFWNASEGRWQMVDAQLDETWCAQIGFQGDPLAITPVEFVTAGQAWRAWRAGEINADRCGLSAINLHGAFWIAGNLRLDLAALNKVEMLPWDSWGKGWGPGDQPTDEHLRMFDSVAELTLDPDATFDELRERYDTDERLRMPGKVFNELRQATETV